MNYYDISELAGETGLTAHTLRYYEREALIINVPRDSSGRRRYNERHLLGVKFINALRTTGMPIRTIKTYLDLYHEGDSTQEDRLDLLVSHREKVKADLEAIKINLKIVDKKIKAYEELLETLPRMPEDQFEENLGASAKLIESLSLTD